MYLKNLIALRNDYLFGSTHSAPALAPPWFWPKLSYTAFSAKGDPHTAVLKIIKANKDYELANSGLKFWLPNADFFGADSAEFAQFLTLAQTLFAPFSLSNKAKKPDNFDKPEKHPLPTAKPTDREY